MKKTKYATVCIEEQHIVIDPAIIKSFKVLDNGFMFEAGNNTYYSPYFFQSNNIEECQDFAEYQETLSKNPHVKVQETKCKCGDSL